MSKIRKIRTILTAKPTIEGAGVHLRRVFGFGEVPLFDPFLMLDDFRSDTPTHFLPGFPWHPHRGIETITYVLEGDVEHGDSLGNKGVIGSGDVQWMTAGSGIIHQEMPMGDADGRMYGFQLWANLPAAHKMMDPRYRDITASQIPEVTLPDGVTLKIIAGQVSGVTGPVTDIVINPEFLDVSVPAGTEFIHPTKPGTTVFAYVIEGQGGFGEGESPTVNNRSVALFGDGDRIVFSAGTDNARFLLVSGMPLNEPVAWQGPIVMNTKEELQTAFMEYRQGNFIKHK